ncbi:RAMP superfamily CRISPR-associated protein [Sphaerothrix gracilis]|uniref:RAMP superfamily CRISPR-associated protein n=1 Tax=Sphaerothrix gracilis TaxID=3151835 RepID=UPI0031FD319A
MYRGSSLKGFLRAWARNAQQEAFNRLLGFLEGDKAAVAAVQILDAFPTAPCLKLDMANPQWTWKGNQVRYGTVPHSLLSMAEVTLKIGLTRTSIGSAADVEVVKNWLKQAFQAEGLGSRVSAGYGQATRIDGSASTSFSSLTHPHSSEHPFEFWSQGIYGPNEKTPEFRSVAVRGVLRYWFRAVALALYSADDCRTLEQKVFGGIEPQPQEGSFKLISVLDDEDVGSQIKPHSGTGKLILQTKKNQHLVLLQALLKLAFHIGGLGRGARRPLHWNSGRLRGCFWQVTTPEEILPCTLQAWEQFFQDLLTAFDQVLPVSVPALTPQPTATPNLSRPQRPKPKLKKTEGRTQDILNKNARIYLIRSPKLKHPSQVHQWRDEGDKYRVRGAALEFFYKSGFKGGEKGNPQVGGSLGTPSFVWIQSNGLHTPADAYQVMTLFGVDNAERAKFLQKIQDPSQVKEKIEITLPW